jgi:tRNA pseudouridine55 synthase
MKSQAKGKQEMVNQMTTKSSNPLLNKDIPEGVLLVDKPKGKTSFSLIAALRKILNVQKIGHAGTLDPMATGLMVILIGKRYTTLSDQLISSDKEYLAEITLGSATDTYDAEGTVTNTSSFIPTLDQVASALKAFQGTIFQTPPMFSAKKVQGKKLYDLARQGLHIERKKVEVKVHIELLEYLYPKIHLQIYCSKGTYVRAIAHDLGEALNCHGHLSALVRSRSGKFSLQNCLSGDQIFNTPLDVAKQTVLKHLLKTV